MYNTSQCDNTLAGTRFLSCVQQLRSRLGRTGAVTWICSSSRASVWWWIVVVLKLSVFHLLLKTGLHYLETAPAVDSGSASGSGLQLWELLLATIEVQPYFSVRCFCSRIWVSRSAGRFLLRELCLVSWLAVLCDQHFLLLVSLFYNLLQIPPPGCWLTDWLVVEAWLIALPLDGGINGKLWGAQIWRFQWVWQSADRSINICFLLSHTHTLTDTWRMMMWCSVMVCDEVHLLSAAHMLWMTFHTKLPWASSVAVGKLPIREVNLNASCLQKLISTWSLSFTLK